MRAQERAVLGVNVTAAELRGLLEAARRGPFLFLRDGTGAQQVITLGGDRLVLGRASGSDLELSWDPRVSGVHAHLERRGPRWVVDDNGLSRNGTYVNGKRIRGQRTLADGDLIQMGDTLIGFRDPGPRVPATVTVPTVKAPAISPAQRRVLIERVCDQPEGAHDRGTVEVLARVADCDAVGRCVAARLHMAGDRAGL